MKDNKVLTAKEFIEAFEFLRVRSEIDAIDSENQPLILTHSWFEFFKKEYPNEKWEDCE